VTVSVFYSAVSGVWAASGELGPGGCFWLFVIGAVLGILMGIKDQLDK
jgi:hypothetical protein